MVFDTKLFQVINGFAGYSKFLDIVGVFFASYIPYLLVFGTLLIIFWTDKHWKQRAYDFFLVTFSALIARGILTPIIRFIYVRPRPFLAFPDITVLIPKTVEASFPSGHATFFFALAIALYFTHRRWSYYCLAGAILMSAARIFVGVHYPLDILGGALVGGVSVWIARYILPSRTKNK